MFQLNSYPFSVANIFPQMLEQVFGKPDHLHFGVSDGLAGNLL